MLNVVRIISCTKCHSDMCGRHPVRTSSTLLTGCSQTHRVCTQMHRQFHYLTIVQFPIYARNCIQHIPIWCHWCFCMYLDWVTTISLILFSGDSSWCYYDCSIPALFNETFQHIKSNYTFFFVVLHGNILLKTYPYVQEIIHTNVFVLVWRYWTFLQLLTLDLNVTELPANTLTLLLFHQVDELCFSLLTLACQPFIFVQLCSHLWVKVVLLPQHGLISCFLG